MRPARADQALKAEHSSLGAQCTPQEHQVANLAAHGKPKELQLCSTPVCSLASAGVSEESNPMT